MDLHKRVERTDKMRVKLRQPEGARSPQHLCHDLECVKFCLPAFMTMVTQPSFVTQLDASVVVFGTF
jgi:hypothetical protein